MIISDTLQAKVTVMARAPHDFERLSPSIRALHARGRSVRAISAEIGISERSVSHMLRRLGLSRVRRGPSGVTRKRALPVGTCLEIRVHAA